MQYTYNIKIIYFYYLLPKKKFKFDLNFFGNIQNIQFVNLIIRIIFKVKTLYKSRSLFFRIFENINIF